MRFSLILYGFSWILYDNRQWLTQWLSQEEGPKNFPKPDFHQKNVTVTGGLLPVRSSRAFWILAKPLHLRSMLSKSMRCTESCNACTRHWSTETTQFFSTTENTRPHITQPVLQKLKEFGANFASFVSSTIFTWHLANQLLLLQASQQLFAEKTLPQPEGHRKCSLRVHVITKHGFFSYRNQLISHRQNVLTVMIPILNNKDVFEPSYNESWSETIITFAPTK